MTTDVAGKKNGMLTLTTDGGNIELPLEGETIPAVALISQVCL